MDATPEAAQARAARIAGAMYLVALVTAVFAHYFVRASVHVPGDPARTAENIAGAERLFRIGIASDLVSFTGAAIPQLAGPAAVFIYELILGSWLLLRGARIARLEVHTA